MTQVINLLSKERALLRVYRQACVRESLENLAQLRLVFLCVLTHGEEVVEIKEHGIPYQAYHNDGHKTGEGDG